MTEKPWHYLINSFQAATKENYKRADKVGLFTYNALLAVDPGDAELVALKTYYGPIYLGYKADYDRWLAAGGQEEGATLSLEQLEDLINADVNNWEFAIQGVFRKGTPGYKTLFPDGITPLKRGTREQRIARLNALSINLEPTAALATTRTAVNARITQLQSSTATQDGKQYQQGLDSDAVELARVGLCTALYYVLGGLMMRYSSTPDNIANYFDLETLRAKPQTEFNDSVPAAGSKFIVRRKQEPGDEISLHNTGTVPLMFFFAPHKDAPYPAGLVSKTVASGEDITIPSTEVGATDENVYLIVKNTSTSVDGHWVVTL